METKKADQEVKTREKGLKIALLTVLKREDHAWLFGRDREGSHGSYAPKDNDYSSTESKCPKSFDGEHCWHETKESYGHQEMQEYSTIMITVEDGECTVNTCCHCGKRA